MITEEQIQYVRLMTFVHYEILNDDQLKLALEYEYRFSKFRGKVDLGNHEVLELGNTVVDRLSEIPDFYTRVQEGLYFWENKEKPIIKMTKEFYHDPVIYSVFIKSLPLYSLEKMLQSGEENPVVSEIYRERVHVLKEKLSALEKNRVCKIEFERIKHVTLFVDSTKVTVVFNNCKEMVDSVLNQKLEQFNFTPFNWQYLTDPMVVEDRDLLLSLCKDDKITII